MDAELRAFNVDKELGGKHEISWNHIEFEVRHEISWNHIEFEARHEISWNHIEFEARHEISWNHIEFELRTGRDITNLVTKAMNLC